MKKKLLVMGLLAGTALFAETHFSIGVGVGAPGYYPPAPPVVAAQPPMPGPGYTWVDGYWDNGVWVNGYWAPPDYGYVAPAPYYAAPPAYYAPYYAPHRDWDDFHRDRDWDHDRGRDHERGRAADRGHDFRR